MRRRPRPTRGLSSQEKKESCVIYSKFFDMDIVNVLSKFLK
jgi:hypothetical protein